MGTKIKNQQFKGEFDQPSQNTIPNFVVFIQFSDPKLVDIDRCTFDRCQTSRSVRLKRWINREVKVAKILFLARGLVCVLASPF